MWLTDSVGWLPVSPEEGWLTSDYNTEMIEHIERLPHIRDLSIFVGNPDDIVADAFGPGLPGIREWTESHYTFPGYFRNPLVQSRGSLEEIRAQLGWPEDERVIVATVGGTAVGRPLLQRVIEGFRVALELIGNLRLVVVAGPRIDPASLPREDGITVYGYLPHLEQHLVACDLALVQGGLSTTMELVAARRPFLYFPLRRHFEQTFHVPKRLSNYGVPVDVRCDFETLTPERLPDSIALALTRTPSYKPVESGAQSVAARRIAELL